jgi:hypothetical protein
MPTGINSTLSRRWALGKTGIVLVAKNKTELSVRAVKVLGLEERYWREKQVYQRLAMKAVTKILRFNTPQLIDSDDGLLVIEMTIVKRPFVLDFASAYLDKRPEFSEETWATWEDEKKEQFEARWPKVQEVLSAFEGLGVYLMDVSPGNIGFPDEPGW